MTEAFDDLATRTDSDEHGLPPDFSDEAWPTPSDPDLVDGARWRKAIRGLAPAGVFLPLAILLWLVYLLAPGWFGRAEPAIQITLTRAASTVIPATPTTPIPEYTPPPLDEFDDLLVEAEALTWRSEFDQAIEIYQDLARRWPNDAHPEIGWARALLLDSLPDQALIHAQQALVIEPDNVEAMTVLACAYVDLGDKARGLSTAQLAVQLDADEAEAHAVLASAYLLNGQPAAAVEEANLALTQNGRSAEAHRVRGKLYETIDHDLGRAIREFRLAADLQPRLWLRHYDLGLALLKTEDYDAAIVALTEAWVLRRTLVTYGALGHAYYRLGQYDRAASYLEQSLTAGAWNVDTYALLASINAQRGRCSDVAAYARQALAQDPNSPLALEARDLCQESASEHATTPPVPSTIQVQAEAPPPRELDGQLAFPVWNVETGQYDTYVAKVDGSERRLVVEGMHQPAFSPDGRWLAVNGERHERLNLFIVQPDGRGLREITEHVEDGLPCWSSALLQESAGEQRLAFSSTRHGDKQSRVYILDRVPLEGKKVQARALNSGPDDVRGEYPAWAAGAGQAYIVYSGCYYDGVSAQCGLMLMSAEPGPQTLRPLTAHPEDTAPAAHGIQIAFMSNRDGNWEIYLVNSDGSELKRLTHSPSNDGLPTWSPDGETLAFVSDEGGTWAVWTISLNGSDRRKLFDIGGSGLISDWQHERISWGPEF